MANKRSKTSPADRYLVVDEDGDIVYTCTDEAELKDCLEDEDGLDEDDPMTLYVYTLTKSVTLILEKKMSIKEMPVK